MSEARGIGPERMGELVDGASPAGEEERAFVALMAEARGLEQGAPDDLRARVLAAARAGEGAAEPSAARPAAGRALGALHPGRWLGDGAARRRRLLVAAPVTAAIVALVVAIPVLDGNGGPAATTPVAGAGAERPSGGEPGRGEGAFDSAAPSAGSIEAAPPAEAGAEAAVPAPAPGPDAAPGRLQRVAVRTRVQVEDVAALSRASSSAMRTVRRLGGFTASSDYGVPDGSRGGNALVFRVPVERVDAALAAFADLGTVLRQDADIVDVTDRVAAGDARVARLREELAVARAAAAADPSDAGRARAVMRAGARLERAQAAVAAQRRAARLATLELTLTTEGPAAAPAEEGRFTGPIAAAGDRLAGGLAWLLGALVLLAPFAVLAALAAWGTRRLRGRAARRLMRSA